VFQFLPRAVLAETKVLTFAIADAFRFGILSSRAHVTFANAAGGWLGVGNDSTYNHSECFFPFPFPACSDELALRVGDLGEQLDAHRKRQQAQHDDLTITGMYNVVEKLRAGVPLTAKEKIVHEHGLISVLKKIHDDLDALVFDAFGWPHILTDEQILERLVALNAERAAEERREIVRWLRPEFQNQDAPQRMTQVALVEGDDDDAGAATAGIADAVANWPKKLSEQVGSVRDLLTRGGSTEWAAADVVAALKGATEAEVAEVLDSLSALGLLVTYELPEGRRWRSAAYLSRGSKSIPPGDVPKLVEFVK
jgi:hypothetical protein